MDVTIYAGNAGDRNDRGMCGAIDLGTGIARQLDVEARVVGTPTAPIAGGWATQLQAASPNLAQLAAHVAERLRGDHRIMLVMGRCAASLATLPVVARCFPDAAIVYFDAHGDCNRPDMGGTTDTNYLGGMVITGAAGEWDTGFGGGVDLGNVILVGARDLDPPERARIEAGQLRLVPVGPRLGQRLGAAIRGRRVYIHLDCDVLDAGLIASEYQLPGGVSFPDLREAFEALAGHDVVGFEITEFEACWPDGRPNRLDELVAAIRPVLETLTATPGR